MGLCCSNEQKPRSFRESAFDKHRFSTYQLEQIEDYQRYTPSDWDDTLQDILSGIKTKNPYWSYFTTIFSDCGVQSKFSLNIEARSQNQSIHVTQKELETMTIIEEYSFIETIDTSQFNLSKSRLQVSLDASRIVDSSSPVNTPGLSSPRFCGSTRCASVENLVKSFEKPSSIYLPNPGKEGLRNSLYFLLSENNHIVQTFLRRYHRKFENKFEKELSKLKSRRFTERDDAMYRSLCELIKLIALVLKKFIMWMYDDLFSLMKPVIKNEFLEHEWIAESVIYEFLFSQLDSTQNRLTLSLIKARNASKTKKLQKILKKRGLQNLGGDSNFAKSHSLFALKTRITPYKEVIQRICELQVDGSPHQEFEKVISLEKEILECACKYYNNKSEVTAKLVDGFDRDVKVEILIYCISRSQNADLIVSNAFIREFVHKDYLEHVQSFSAFRALLDFLLDE